MHLQYRTVDVFTDQPFGGNPLAVVLDADALSGAAMQRIAREFSYSETSFVLRPVDPAHHARVRIFTPGQELPFAGHPNVGTAFVLAREAMQRGAAVPELLLFEQAAGPVRVGVLRRNGAPTGAELTAPAAFGRLGEADPGAVAAALGLAADAVATGRHPPLVGSVGLPFLLAELVDADAVDSAVADRGRLSALLHAGGVAGSYLYARLPDGALHARMLWPLDGIGEDPATGSAAAALGGLLGSLHGGPLRLLIRQGVAMGRPSAITVTVRDGEVRVAGECVPMMDGRLVSPASD